MPIRLTKQTVVFIEEFVKSLNRLDGFDKKLVLKKIGHILETENTTNIRKLKNYPLAEYRLRIGDFRILFNVDEERGKVLFLACVHRKDLY